MHELLRQQSAAAVGRYGEGVPLRRDPEEVEVSQAGDDATRVQDRLQDQVSSVNIECQIIFQGIYLIGIYIQSRISFS